MLPIKTSSKAHASPASKSNALDVLVFATTTPNHSLPAESISKDGNAIQRTSPPVMRMPCALQGTMPDRTPTHPPPILTDHFEIISSKKRPRQTIASNNDNISVLEAIGTEPKNDAEKQHPRPLRKQRKSTDHVQTTLLCPHSNSERPAGDTIPAIHISTEHENASLGRSRDCFSILECINSAATTAMLPHPMLDRKPTVLYLQAQCSVADITATATDILRDPKEKLGDALADDNACLESSEGEIIETNQIDEANKDDDGVTATDQPAEPTKRKDKNKSFIVSETEVLKPRRSMDADNLLSQETHESATVIANDIKQINQVSSDTSTSNCINDSEKNNVSRHTIECSVPNETTTLICPTNSTSSATASFSGLERRINFEKVKNANPIIERGLSNEKKLSSNPFNSNNSVKESSIHGFEMKMESRSIFEKSTNAKNIAECNVSNQKTTLSDYSEIYSSKFGMSGPSVKIYPNKQIYSSIHPSISSPEVNIFVQKEHTPKQSITALGTSSLRKRKRFALACKDTVTDAQEFKQSSQSNMQRNFKECDNRNNGKDLTCSISREEKEAVFELIDRPNLNGTDVSFSVDAKTPGITEVDLHKVIQQRDECQFSPAATTGIVYHNVKTFTSEISTLSSNIYTTSTSQQSLGQNKVLEQRKQTIQERRQHEFNPVFCAGEYCHICRKRRPNVVSFGCGRSHSFCDNHLKSHLNTSFDIQQIKSKLKCCPICSFECPCAKCKRGRQTLRKAQNVNGTVEKINATDEINTCRPEITRKNTKIIGENKTGNDILVHEDEKCKERSKEADNASFVASDDNFMKEDYEQSDRATSSMIGKTKATVQIDTCQPERTSKNTTIAGENTKSNDGLAHDDEKCKEREGKNAMFEASDDNFLKKDGEQSDRATNGISKCDVLKDGAPQHTSRNAFMQELIKAAEEQELSPSFLRNHECHLCHNRKPKVLHFGCKKLHAFCEKHINSRLGINFDTQEFESKLNRCPVCCFECPCSKCVRDSEKLWNRYTKSFPKAVVVKDNVELKEMKAQSSTEASSTEASTDKQGNKILKEPIGQQRITRGGTTKAIFLQESDQECNDLTASTTKNIECNIGCEASQQQHLREVFIQELRRASQGQPTCIHLFNQKNCHVCHKRRSTVVDFGCGKVRHAFCIPHVKSHLGMDVEELKSKLDYCPICCLECKCSKCQRDLSALWSTHQRKLSSANIKEEKKFHPTETSGIRIEFEKEEKKQGSAPTETSGKVAEIVIELNEDNSPLPSVLNQTRDDFMQELKRITQTNQPLCLSMSYNEVCHVCHFRKPKLVSFGCGLSHHFCESHVKSRLGVELEIEQIKGKLNCCPVCSLECRCSKCKRTLDKKWEARNHCIERKETHHSNDISMQEGDRQYTQSTASLIEHSNAPYSSSFVRPEPPEERPKDIKPCPFEGKSDVSWYCFRCADYHWVENRNALHPFGRKHGYRFEHVAADGDCFFTWYVNVIIQLIIV